MGCAHDKGCIACRMITFFQVFVWSATIIFGMLQCSHAVGVTLPASCILSQAAQCVQLKTKSSRHQLSAFWLFRDPYILHLKLSVVFFYLKDRSLEAFVLHMSLALDKLHKADRRESVRMCVPTVGEIVSG